MYQPAARAPWRIEGGQPAASCALSPAVDRFIPTLFRLLIVGTFAACLPPAIGAEEKRNTRPVLDPPPPAMPAAVSVARGGRIEIPLRIYGVQNESLRFLIKKPPMHGRLSEPRPTAREVSSVVYEPPSELAVTADRFTYSVQSHAGVSAPVEVTISIVDLPTQFSVPASIDFGELLAGETAVREIEVANRGGGLAEGTVEVDPPLRVEGRTKYSLHAGDYTYFKIVFAPTEGGIFRREIRYTSDRQFITSVTGSAQAPISAAPTRIELRHSPDSAVRAGAFEIINRTGEDRAFKLRGGPRLQLAAEVTVPAHGRTAVAVSTRADDVAALEDAELRVESGTFALVVPVRAQTVGPILHLPQASVGLGRVDALRGLQSGVEIENVGGTTAQVVAEVGAPFFLPETTFGVAPGERKRIRLNVLPGEPQRYRTWLKFKAGPTEAELEVDAELVSGMNSPARNARVEERDKPSATPAPVAPPPWMPDLELAKSIRVTHVTPTSADVEWPLDMDGAAAFRLERLILTRDSAGNFRNAWTEIPKTTFSRRPPLWIASLTGLTPNQSQTIRIVPLGPEGQPRAPLVRLDFSTAPRVTLPAPRLLPSLAILLLAIGAFALFRRLRRHCTEPLSGF